MDTCSRSESDRENNYSDIATLPGVKVPFVVRPEPVPRKTMRNSIRKLPRKSSSAKDKKKEGDKRKASESEKSKQNGKKLSASPPEQEKPTCSTASSPDSGQTGNACQGGATDTCEKVVVTQLDRPIMGSLDASELMLISSDKGDLGTMVSAPPPPPLLCQCCNLIQYILININRNFVLLSYPASIAKQKFRRLEYVMCN